MSFHSSLYRYCLTMLVLFAGMVKSAYVLAGDPTFTAAFSPSTIAPGASSTLTFTIDNTANDTALGSAAFSATLPTGVTIAASPNASTDCNSAQISASSGGTSISFSEARIGTGTSCTYSLVVTSSTVGTHSLTTGTLSSSAGTHTTANADLTVSSTLPSLTLSASPATLAPGEVTTLTYTIDNSLSGTNATFVDFTHLLSDGFEFAESPLFSHDCPLRMISTFVLGSFAINTTAQSVTANDVEVNAGASCTATVKVKAPESIGTFHLETGSLSSSAGTSGPASASITVENSITNGSVMAVSFSEEASPGETVTLDFELVNTDRDNDITGLNFTADLNAALSGLAATALPATGFCGSGATISGTSNLSVSNVSLASGGTCSFSVSVLVPSNAAAGNYTFTSSTINLTRGGATTSSAASATLRVQKAPLLSMQFLSSSAAAGEDVTMRFTVTNTDTTNAASDITFSVLTTDGIPGFVAKTLPAANYCGTGSTSSTTTETSGTVTGFTMSGGNLTAGANCTFDVVLTVPDDAQSGTYSFTSSSGTATVSSSSLGLGDATAQLSISAAPSLAFSITESNVVPGGTITLNFSLNYNENASSDATGVGFTVDLDTPLTGLASTSGTQNDICGSGSSFSGTSTLTATGITMSAGDTCDFTVTAQVPGSAVAGTVTITSSTVSASVSSSSVTSAAVSDDFTVSGLNLSHEFLTDPALPSSDVVIRYTITNDANALAATAIQFTHDLTAVISGLAVNGSLPSTPCNGSSAITGTTNLSFSAGELTPGANCSFDVTVAIPASTDGIYTSTTSSASATVNSTNTTFGASSANLNVVPLTVQLSTSESSPTSSTSIPINIGFSRDVVNFVESDLTIGNGSISDFTGSGSNYSATLTPSADGTVTIDLPANAVDDSVDNTVKNPAATQLSIVYEASPASPTPSLVIASPSASVASSGPITFDVTYSNSEETNLTTTSITLNSTGDAAGTVTVTDGTTTTPVVNVTNITGDGTLGISIASGTARNGDKQAGAAGPSTTFNVDNTAPTVTIVDQVANPFNAAFQAEITFSENVTGFTVDDLSFTNANLSNFSGSNNFYTVTVTPIADGQVTGTLAADSAMDAAGNGNTAAPGFGMVYDATKPTVVISSSESDVNSAFTATFTFSETVTGFGSDDVSVNNGTISNFNASSGTIYTATITPTVEGQVTIDVAADAATDAAGNNSNAATQYSVNYDTSAPGVSMSAQSALAQGNTTVTFTFTENVTGFTVNDISVGNGSASNFASTSGSVYTATISATNDGTVTVDVPSASATDAAGNSNTAASQISFVSDSTAPTLSNTLPVDDASGVAFGSNLVFTFSEAIQLNTGSSGSLLLHELSPGNNIVDTLSFSVSAGSLTGPGTASISSNTLTLDLDSDLNVGTRYAVQISAGLLTDTAGNSFTGITNNTDWNFVTQPSVRLSSNQTTLTEELAEQATVTVALFDAQNQPFTTPSDVTLSMSFSGSTATENSDFSVSGLTTGSLTISANASSNTFTVTAITDSVADDNETLEIAVDSVSTNNAAEIQQQAISITIVENAVPTLTGAPTSISLSEDIKGRIDFSDTQITDAEDDTLTLTVSINTGRVVSPRGSAGGVTVTPTGPTSIQLIGKSAALTSFLDFPDVIAILPPKNHVSSMTLSLVLSDGTEQADTQNIPVSITPVNDAPRLITGTIAEFDMTGGSISSALVFTETADSRTMTVTLDAGNWVNTDLDTFGGSTDEALYSDSEAATSTVTVAFDQKVNLESLVYFFNVGSAPQSLTLTPTGHRGEAISLTSSDFTVDEAGVSVDLRGWLGITSFTITSSSGAFAPGLDTIVYSLPPVDFSFQEDQPGNLDFSALSLSDEDSSAPTLKITADSGTLSLPAGRPASSVASLSGSVSVSIENNVITITGTIDDINSYLSDSSNIQYTPDSEESGSDVATITITVNDNDGSGDVELQSITVDVTAVNDAPTISNLDGDSVSYVQNGGAVALDASSNAVAADVDHDNLDGGSLTVAITSGGASSEDLLSVSNTVTLASSSSGANVTVDNTVIGTLGNAVSEGNDFVVNFNSEATLSRVSSLLNALTFENTSNTSPTEGNRTISITLNDGEDDSSSAQVTLSFTALDLDSTITWLGIDGNLEVTNNSSSNPAGYYTLVLGDSGDDGIDTTINSIAFDVTGTMDIDTVSFLLAYTASSSSGTETQTGVYSNGVVTFTSSIVVPNSTSSAILVLQVYLNQTTDLVDQSNLSVSLDPSTDIQTSDYSSAIGSTDVLSSSQNPLTLDIDASELIFSTEPAGSVSGVALTTQPVLRAQDTYGNLDTDFNSVVRLSESSDGSLSGTTEMSASSGIAAFSGLVYTATQDNESFALSATVSLNSWTSMQPTSTQVVSDVVATRVSFQTEPSPVAINAEAATSFTTVPVLMAVDAQGIIDEDYNEEVTLSESNGPGTAQLNADNDSDIDNTTVTLNFSSGQVTAEGLSVTYSVSGSGNETFNLLASSGSLTSATSTSIAVNDLPSLEGAPAEITVIEDVNSNLDLTDLVLSDSDGNELTVTFTVTAGTLSTIGGDGTANGVTVSGNETATLTLQGSVSDLTTLLSSASELSYLTALDDDTDATLSIVVNDGQVDGAASNISLAITPVNDQPTISGTADANVEQGGQYSFTPTGADVDGDNLTYSVQNQPDWTSFDSATGELSGAPDNDDVGTYTDIQISVSDGEFSASLSSFSITVTNVNDAPTISGTPATRVNEDESYSFTPTAVDIDGDSLTFSVSNSPSWLTFNGNTGNLSGTPDNDDVGTYSGITITVSDGVASDTLNAFTIIVSPVNDAPEVSGTAPSSVLQDELYEFYPSVLDIDSTIFVWSVVNAPSWTSFNSSTGALTGTPSSADVGVYPGIVISVSDGVLSASLPSFTIEVVNTNDAPSISGSPITTVLEDESYEFTPLANDPDGDSLTFSVVNQPGWTSFDSQSGALTGVPSNDDVGEYTGVVISVSDGIETTSLDAFSITVLNVNDAPQISGVPQSAVAVGGTYIFEPVAVDVDSEDLVFAINGQPSWAQFDTQTGRLSGTPSLDDVGTYDNIEISVSDGELSASLEVFSVEVRNDNSAPVAVEQAVTVAEDNSITITLAATDPDGDTLTYRIVDTVNSGTVQLIDNLATYSPEPNVSGITETFTFAASDGQVESNVASVTIELTPVNDAPEISGEPQSSVAAGGEYLFEPNASDIDSEQLLFSISGQPSWASFDVQSGRLSGTPVSTDVGIYSDIVISVSDGDIITSLPAFSVEVFSDGAAPTAQDQSLSVAEDNNIEITLVASDTDNDELTYRIVETTSSGVLQLVDNIAQYTPQQDVSGVSDRFTFVANDGESDSNIATVTISITPVNDAPEISGAPQTSVKVLNTYSFSPQASDVDSDTLIFSIENRPDWTEFDADSGLLSGTPSSEDAGVYGGVTIKVSDGELSAQLTSFDIEVLVNSAPELTGIPNVVAQVGEAYRFAPQASDQDGDQLRFSISNLPSWAGFDTSTGALTGTPVSANVGTFSGIVISVTDGLNTVSLPAFNIRVCDVCDNIAPDISGTPASSVTSGEAYEFIPDATDENNDTLQFSIGNMPNWASFDSNTGRLSGTPAQSDVGVYSNIVISVSDGEDSVSMPAFTIEVLSSNSAPTISGSPVTTASSGVQYSFTPSASDADDDDLLFSIVNKPSWASFNPNSGRLRGTPDIDDVGVFSDIIIRVTDGVNGAVALPTFTIEVTAQNSAPVITGTPRTTVTQGTAYRFSPSASDADGDALTFSVSNLPGWLSFDQQTGTMSGTPQEDDVGNYADIEISVSDATDQASLSPFDISVVSSNIAPVATSSEVTTSEDKSVTIVGSVVDENQDELTFSIINPPGNGSLSENGAGWVYTPTADFNGVDSFDFNVSDGELTSELATITINVTAVNDKPIAVDDDITLDQLESGVYTLDVLSNDLDPDIDTNEDELSLQRVSTNLGTAQVVDNQIQVDLGASFIGSVNLTYSLRDDAAKNDTARVSLTINGVADINAPIITVPEDVTLDATGLFTRVNPGTATALDAEGNQLPVSLVNDDLDFAPGVHTIYWQTEDSYGTVSTEEQTITVLPIISLASADTTAEGTSVEVEFLLNGDAPSYPYVVNYTVSGTAEGNGVDYSGGAGSVTFSEGRLAKVNFDVHADSEIEVDETIVVSLNDGQNIGANSTATITISEDNIAPSITLTVLQDDIPTFVVAQDAGSVSIVANATDANPQDSLSLDWTAEGISNLSTTEDSFIFDPSVLDVGRYEASLYVSDDGEPILDATESVVFEIVVSRNELSETVDTDGDLIPDAQEGYGDSDGDGIPDYLDAIEDCNVIASQAEDQSQFLVESEPGVCMRVGDTASQNDSNGVQVVIDDSAPRQARTNQYGERVELLANDLPEDRNYENVGGIFDFVLYDLQSVGQVVRVVLPQSQPIPENALYRKYNPNTELWRGFVSNDKNKVFSAPGAEGNCPPPGASNYKVGLTAGHWCVQLIMSDGGPNDQDGAADASIADPGGVAVFVSDNTKPVALDDSIEMSWNSEIEIDVLQNDSDADSDTLTIRSAEARIGDVEITTNGLLYTASPGYSGSDTVEYYIGDGNGGRANATVSIHIRGNRAPGASDDFAETDNLTAIDIDVLANDIDVDGDEISVVSAVANSGSVTVLADNLIRYTPEISFSGLDVVTYEVVDTNGATDTAVISVFVNGNETPIAVPDSVVTEYETSVTVNVLSNDSDPDGDMLMVVAVQANHGSVIVNEDNTVTYTPRAGFSGTDVISYTISDGVLDASSQVTVTVNPEPIEVVKVTGTSGGTLALWWISLCLLLLCYRLSFPVQQGQKRYKI